ncbi:hypothetical protein ACFV2L_35830 [Streptomyces sp. NPDC059687]
MHLLVEDFDHPVEDLLILAGTSRGELLAGLASDGRRPGEKVFPVLGISC